MPKRQVKRRDKISQRFSHWQALLSSQFPIRYASQKHYFRPDIVLIVILCSQCVFLLFLCNRHWFNKAPGPDPRGTELGVTYLPSTISSDAGYADLPLPLLGAPVSIGALVKLGSRSLAKQDRDWSSRPPGTGLHVPFRRHRGSAAIHPSRSRD